MQTKQIKRNRRHKRVRAKVKGTAKCPRFSVSRSNKYIYLQLVDDLKGKTLASVHSSKIKKDKMSKAEIAKKAGQLIAKKALTDKINRVVFDRGGYKYHGRIKAVAEGAREAGLKF